MIVRGETTQPLLTRELELRVDQPDDFEASQAAETGDARSEVPWPLSPSEMVDFYYSSPWLGAIGNILGDAVGAAQWDLKARDADLQGKPIASPSSEEEARARAWLSREDVGGDGVTTLDIAGLLKASSKTYDVTHNLFLEVVRNRAGTEPMRLVKILPQYVRYYAGQDGAMYLRQSDPWRGIFDFVPFGTRAAGGDAAKEREYLHQREPNDISTFYGVPGWIYARDSVTLDNEHRKYLRGFFQRHTTPRYMITITQDPNWTGGQPDDQKLEAVYQHVRSFLNANAGEMAGRNLILQYPGGILVKAEPLDVKLEDPTFPNTALNVRNEIMAVRHVSLMDLGLPEGGYRATAQEQSDNFRQQVLRPFSNPVVAMINRVLHAPAPAGLGVQGWDFHLEFERADDTLRRVQGVVTAVGGPVLTQPEGRKILGYEPKGLDELFVPVNMVPGLPLPGGPDGGSIQGGGA